MVLRETGQWSRESEVMIYYTNIAYTRFQGELLTLSASTEGHQIIKYKKYIYAR